MSSLHSLGLYPPQVNELKFWLPWDLMKKSHGYSVNELKKYRYYLQEIRSHTLFLIRDYSDATQVAILDKKTISKPTWTPVTLWNFMFAHTLFSNVLNSISFSTPPTVYYDRRTLTIERRTEFHNYINDKDSYYDYKRLKRYQGKLPDILEASSHLEPCIWAADFVAAAYRLKFVKADSQYADILTSKLIKGRECIFW
jgi:hypothetical protein